MALPLERQGLMVTRVLTVTLAAICQQIVELAKSRAPLLGGISAQVLGTHTAVPFVTVPNGTAAYVAETYGVFSLSSTARA